MNYPINLCQFFRIYKYLFRVFALCQILGKGSSKLQWANVFENERIHWINSVKFEPQIKEQSIIPNNAHHAAGVVIFFWQHLKIE